MSKIDIRPYVAKPGKKVKLDDWPTHVSAHYSSERDYKEILAERVSELDGLQQRLYAAQSHAILIVLQGIDAAGKDGAVRHIMTGINPEGCDVTSFKQPSAEELGHDFLWRTTRRLPPRGQIGIFNRSYYEEVLVVRVHPEMLEAEHLPLLAARRKHFWHERFKSIVENEEHLTRNGTRIVKIFLHLSKEEQKRRFLERIDDATHNWKFSPNDITERGYWSRYMKAYGECIGATSIKEAPWHIVPADDKYNARLIISSVICDALSQLHLNFPVSTPERKRQLASIAVELKKE